MATARISDGWWIVWLGPFVRNPDGCTAFGARTSFDEAHVFPLLFTSMQKANPIVELIEQIVNEEVDKAYTLHQADKALTLSNRRRKEFKKTFRGVFSEVDSLNIGRDPLNLEADATTTPPTAPSTTPTNVPAAPTPANTPAAPATGDPAAPVPGTDPLNGTASGAPSDPAVTGVDATGTDPANAPGMDAGGGGFGGFSGGGGGGGGVGDDTIGGGEETPGGEMSGNEGEAGEEEPIGDPIDAMVSGAQELLSQTQDPNLILKSLKGQIQTVFKEPSHALGMIKALYDTNDSILQSVAQRLYLFIKSSS